MFLEMCTTSLEKEHNIPTAEPTSSDAHPCTTTDNGLVDYTKLVVGNQSCPTQIYHRRTTIRCCSDRLYRQAQETSFHLKLCPSGSCADKWRPACPLHTRLRLVDLSALPEIGVQIYKDFQCCEVQDWLGCVGIQGNCLPNRGSAIEHYINLRDTLHNVQEILLHFT